MDEHMEQTAEETLPIGDDYREVFGLEDTREEAQETAENGSDPDEGTDTGETAESAQEPQERQEMTPEERHQQAAARRAREEQQRQAQQQAATQAAVDAVYEKMFRGQTDPYTGRPILTEADFQAYEARQRQQERNEALENAGLDAEVIRGIVDEQTRPMQQQLMESQMREARARAQAANEQADRIIGQALQDVAQLMPEIHTMDDIIAMPTGQRFNELIQRGNTIQDAFWLANREQLMQQSAKAAHAAAINGAANRNHLSGAVGGGDMGAEVPAAMLEVYREMNPDASLSDIRKMYNRDRNK